MNKQVKFNIT